MMSVHVSNYLDFAQYSLVSRKCYLEILNVH